jgi:large subunit ribosomal protein L5
VHSLEKFYLKTLQYDINNKYLLKSIKDIPKLKKIVLNHNCSSKPLNLKLLASSMLALELITGQKGTLTKTSSPNISLRLKKGTPIGCKLTLKKEAKYEFLSKIMKESTPSSKTFKLFKSNQLEKAFSFDIVELFSFNEVEKQYRIFTNLTALNVTITANSESSFNFKFLIKTLQLLLK